MRALGIDVGGSRKKLDLVVLDRRREPTFVASRVDVGDVERLVRDLAPDVIAIDSPPAWAPTGQGSRETERQLAMLGIRSFNTPSRERGEASRFYDWMRTGFDVFAAAERAGFPRYDGRAVAGTAMEVFPHATETVLAGCLPPLEADKRAWRLRLLRRQEVRVTELRSLDQIDAALAALTGLLALELKEPFAPGIPAEGLIVLPTRVPPGVYARCEADPEDETVPLIRFCACGCGAEVRPGREFRAGHDAKLKARLLHQMRDGEAARKELDRRKWL
jgi:predicted nuclease with RNAse H fold